MVARTDPTVKMLFRTIRHSFGRFLAILAIIALGSGFYAGLSVSTKAMVTTADEFYRRHDFYDFRLLSTLGFKADDVAAVAATDGVSDAEGSVFRDFLSRDSNGEEKVLKAHLLTERINTPELASGRMPEAPDECLLDYYYFRDNSIGDIVQVCPENDADTLDLFLFDEYRVVGMVYSPLYLNYERGTTELGSGSVAGFVYIPEAGLDTEYYSEIYVTLNGAPVIYSDEYNDMAESIEGALTTVTEHRAELRFSDIRSDAWIEIEDARGELASGWVDYRQERAEAEAELADARLELDNARTELDNGWAEYYNGWAELNSEVEKATAELNDAEVELEDAHAELIDGEAEYADALAELNDGEADYSEGQAELADAEAEYADALAELNEGEADYAEGLDDYNAGFAEYEDALELYEEGLAELEDASDELEAAKDELRAAKELLNQAEDAYTALTAYYSAISAYSSSPAEFAAQLSEKAALIGAADAFLAQYGIDSATLLYMLSDADSREEASAYLVELWSFMSGSGYAFGDANELVSELGYALQICGGVADYTAIYDGSAGVVGFLTDWTYFSAVLDASLDGLSVPGDHTLTSGNLAVLRYGIDEGWSDYDSGYSKYRRGLDQFHAAEDELAEGAAELEDAKAKLDDARAELDDARAELDDGWAKAADARTELDDGLAELADARAELDDGWAKAADARAELDDGWRQYEDGLAELADGRETLATEKADGERELYNAYNELQDGETEYSDGVEEYEQGLVDFERETADAEVELNDAESEINDAIEDVNDIEPATVYVLGRSSNIGYTCFKSDAEIVAGVAKVFPFFFFLVASLICITTMTRMVSEERTQIGVMKALGYSNWIISRKYIIYACAASILGCAIGLWGGSWLFPSVLWQVYNIMYGNFSDIVFLFDWGFSIALGAAYVLGTIAVTWYCCREELREAPASLIRPKSPKPGKRVFLERIGFIWRRIPFLHKVSARNILRYKQRLFMMLLGIGGCTALLLTGFGLNDSIRNFVHYQFDEISLYDCSVVFDNVDSEASQAGFLAECGNGVADAVFIHSGSVEIEMNDNAKTAYLIAADEPLDGFMDFHSGDAAVAYPGDGQCIVNAKLSDIFGLGIGDKITFRDSDMNYCSLTVAAFFDNYIYNFIYTTPASLSDWGGSSEKNGAYLNFADGADHYSLAAAISAADGVASLSLSADMRARVTGMMSSMVYIVLLVIVCAGALALIVLFNLTNININERSREIATIKVQGFNALETAAYVFRENLILSIIGAVIGLPVGKLLHMYVMSQIQIDLMTFDIRIRLTSYLLSVALTLVFTMLVNFFMYFRLERIDMAESLKSVE